MKKKKTPHKSKHANRGGAVRRPQAAKAKQWPLSPEQLYEKAMALSENFGYILKPLGDGMSVLFVGGMRPWVVLDNDRHLGYEFLSRRGCLKTVLDIDIDPETLAGLSDECLQRVRERDFGFNSRIYGYEDGFALVLWQLSPDGYYWADEDGFGMTADKEVNLHGVIDKECRVAVPFRRLGEHTSPATLLDRARLLETLDK